MTALRRLPALRATTPRCPRCAGCILYDGTETYCLNCGYVLAQRPDTARHVDKRRGQPAPGPARVCVTTRVSTENGRST